MPPLIHQISPMDSSSRGAPPSADLDRTPPPTPTDEHASTDGTPVIIQVGSGFVFIRPGRMESG